MGRMTSMAMRPGDSDSAIDLAITIIKREGTLRYLGVVFDRTLSGKDCTLGPHGNDHYPSIVSIKRGTSCIQKRPPKVFKYPISDDDPISLIRQHAQTHQPSSSPHGGMMS